MEGRPMTEVRFIRQISGDRDGEPWPTPGTVVDLAEAEVCDLELMRVVERVSAKSTITPEAAVAPVPETAAAPKPRARKATHE